MSAIFNFSGASDFFSRGSLCPNPKEPSLTLSLGRHVDVYFPTCKRSRVGAPFVFSAEISQYKHQPSIEVLPDECLFEVFRRLDGQERSICASVSKRWLMLLSTIRTDERCVDKTTRFGTEEKSSSTEINSSLGCNEGSLCSDDIEVQAKDVGDDGYLSRYLEGKKATDVTLAAIAVGTGSRGGLGKLSIRGSNSSSGVTDLGLKSIAHGCSSLRVLSLWNVSSIGDEGLTEIANGCHLLEKLDLCQCPAVTDKALIAIANNCPNLTSLSIECCQNISNGSLQAVGRSCQNLKSVTIKNCPLIGDQGIASLFSLAGHVLTKVKLQSLNISDVSLAVIGHCGKALTDLVLVNLQNANERGFWVMGNGQGLLKLRTFTVTACQGLTDIGLEAVGRGCPDLKQLCLRKCAFVSDNGVASLSKVAVSLESLQLEECHRVTQLGVFGILMNCGSKLKAVALANCLGLKDLAHGFPVMSPCNSVRSLSIRNCPGFGNATLALLGRMCPKLTHVELSGLNGITDEGILPLVQSSEAGLVKVNLSGCVNLTDKAASAIAKIHGFTLELLNLDGCRNITDASLFAIAENCFPLSELDVSNCGITDSGIASLACSELLNMQILSLAGCSSISSKSLPYLGKLGHTLLGLNIQHCCRINSRTVDLLLERLWRCDILY